MESYRGEIFKLYIVEKKTLKHVMVILKRDHDLEISSKAFKTKLSKWGYTKNIKRSEALEISREKSSRESVGKGYDFTLRQRPVDLEKIERHAQRAGLKHVQQGHLWNSARNSTMNVACRTPPPKLPVSLLVIEPWRVSEKLLYDFDILVKGSFEAGHWRFNGNDRIIDSSPTTETQVFEVKSLHDFLGNLDSGCAAAQARNFVLAGSYWKEAFIAIEILVQGHYHDIIPNLIQKINDLNRQGLPELAEKLKQHTAMCSKALLAPGRSHFSIYHGLGELDMGTLVEIEERMMKRFGELFELYLGPLCYNSFVMMMDGARRRLLQNSWTTFEDCLPAISHIDSVFGPSDRRSLDVISLRVEILSRRGLQNETEVEATKLVQRAEMIENDEWQRFYNLTRGWYFVGCAQYFLRKREVAIESFSNALRYADELGKIEDFNIFNTERVTIMKYQEELKGAV